jgi:Domain of unknown function (DUF4349)
MSQRDLVAELRAARVAAPPQVRERVRLIAATAELVPPRRFLRRRSLVLLVPVAAALVGAIVLTTRPSTNPREADLAPLRSAAIGATAGTSTATTANSGSTAKAYAPAPSPTRAQRYGAWIAVQVGSSVAVSQAIDHALRITAALGGHPTSVHASSAGKSGTADLVLRIPRRHVQAAVVQLSRLGTITSEQVDVQDLQSGIDATGRRIARLQKQLATLRAEPQSTQRDLALAAVTAQAQRLQRGEAAVLRSAQLATLHLHVATATPKVTAHHGHGPLHGIGVAAYWIGIGAVYALAFGLPLLLLGLVALLAVRAIRRRRVDVLLSRP